MLRHPACRHHRNRECHSRSGGRRAGKVILHDRAVEEGPLRPLRRGWAVGQLGVALDPDMRGAEAIFGRGILPVQNGVVRNLGVIAQVRIEVEPGVLVFGRRAEESREHQRRGRILRIFDNLGDEIGTASRRIFFSHGNDPPDAKLPLRMRPD
jgi:hypothetical protein